MPRVSIIIPAHNSEKYLNKTLESVFRQTFQDFEIIVVDDGSTDGTRDVVQKYPDKVIYIYQQNQGHAITRNTGIRRSIGEYIAFLDADDLWVETKLEKQVALLDRDKSVGLVHNRIQHIDKEDNLLSTVPIAFQYLSGHIFEHLLLRHAQICTSAVMCRRAVLDDVGLFDEHFPDNIGGEDRELWLRILRKYPAAYIHEPLVLYRCYDKSLSNRRPLDSLIRGRCFTINKALLTERNIWDRFYLKLRAYSNVHYELSYDLTDAGDLPRAMRECLRSIICFPFQTSAYLRLVRLLWHTIMVSNKQSK